MNFQDYCEKNGYQHLLLQWNVKRNGELTPDCVLPKSDRIVWWKCEKGHEWQAMVKNRIKGTGCPICARRTLLPGETDLATTHPDLAAQWDTKQNGNLTPHDVFSGTGRKVWWRCDKGHTWYASVTKRVAGDGCPVCSGKQVISGENDIATTHPDIAQQWANDKNYPLIPTAVSPFSNQNVWWRCQHGHLWKARISSRTFQQSDCPYCTGRKVLAGFNDLQTLDPQTASQWHPTLNGNLKPGMVTTGSHKKIWWICPEDHVWKAAIYSRTRKKKAGCPVCAGNIKTPRTPNIKGHPIGTIPLSKIK